MRLEYAIPYLDRQSFSATSSTFVTPIRSMSESSHSISFVYYSYGKNFNYESDDILIGQMKFFMDNGHWKDTIIIAMADHGTRHGDLRATVQGKFEESLPFFAFIFPPWFKKKYPETVRVFKENARR